MTTIAATLSDDLVAAIDRASRDLNRTREEILRRALESYLEDLEDATLGQQSFEDSTDRWVDWSQARHELLDTD